jgi:hypothetical protein
MSEGREFMEHPKPMTIPHEPLAFATHRGAVAWNPVKALFVLHRDRGQHGIGQPSWDSLRSTGPRSAELAERDAGSTAARSVAWELARSTPWVDAVQRPLSFEMSHLGSYVVDTCHVR